MSNRLIRFFHSGDLGDLVASLAAVKKVCEREGAKAFLYLDKTGGLDSQNSVEIRDTLIKQTGGQGLKMDERGIKFLLPLIVSQPYVENAIAVDRCPSNVDYNLNAFRKYFFDRRLTLTEGQNLMYLQQRLLDVPQQYEPWLEVKPFAQGVKCIVARSLRYQSAHSAFPRFAEYLRGACFIGTDLEHAAFLDAFRFPIPRFKVSDALHAARAIASSQCFIANGTLFYWIGVGMGHPNIVHEVGLDVPTTVFSDADSKRLGITYICGSRIVDAESMNLFKIRGTYSSIKKEAEQE